MAWFRILEIPLSWFSDAILTEENSWQVLFTVYVTALTVTQIKQGYSKGTEQSQAKGYFPFSPQLTCPNYGKPAVTQIIHRAYRIIWMYIAYSVFATGSLKVRLDGRLHDIGVQGHSWQEQKFIFDL